ncbi:phage terminase large subunit [Methylobacterium sp. NEAU K]|uniref:phage terminase large subunit n=1 Tax=Methylobacterium sp. NEAU K TaxID=3064946 RepID=UPI002733AF78|nr:phage terminase large subunit [Methylobacterium sp. NEAU K]MDP4003687.1 phage terminase large subunit [Methylobacterium sp. NEAU K]
MTAFVDMMSVALRGDLATFVEQTFATLEPGTAFSPNWHYEHLCWALARVLRGDLRRLIINVPPRSGKSIIASVAFPMFALGHDPSRRIICVSHTEDLARKFSLDRRTVAQSPWFNAAFPTFRLTGSRPRDLELTTTLRGSVFAAGMGGAVLGRGADVIVVDDPIKAVDALSKAERRRVNEAFDNTLLTRLNDKRRGAIVIVMQRLHADDLVGHVLERDAWEVVSLPAIATEETCHRLSHVPGDLYRRRVGELLHPEREPMAVLEQMRRAQGSLTFQAQYQQDPAPTGGNVIRRAWLRSYDARPRRFDRVVAAWDTASTLSEASDWSVGTVWGALGLDYYLLDVVRGRWESWELRQKIVALSERWRADATLIEKTPLGHALLQDLRRTKALAPILVEPRYDKEARLLAQSARFEAGQVHLPADAPWLGAYIGELLAFPNGRHDDQVDATTYALHYLTACRPRSEPPVRRSRESIRGSNARRRADDTAVVAEEPADLIVEGAQVSVVDGRRILSVPASTPFPAHDAPSEPRGRTVRRSVRDRD